MNLDKIGAVLRNRIKECGYSQEDFAEEAGIGLSSLKKYMSGKVCYDVATLDRFSEVLRCSYDYLLGKTETPNPQYREIKDATKLADGSIERLISAAQDDDTMLVQVFDYLIQNDELVGNAQDYLSIQLHEAEHKDEPEDERYIMLNEYGIIADSMRLGDYRLRAPELANVYLTSLMTAFTKNLDKFGHSVPIRLYRFNGQRKRGNKNDA